MVEGGEGARGGLRFAPLLDGAGEEAGGAGLSADVAVGAIEILVPGGEVDAADFTGQGGLRMPEHPMVGFAFLYAADVAGDLFGECHEFHPSVLMPCSVGFDANKIALYLTYLVGCFDTGNDLRLDGVGLGTNVSGFRDWTAGGLWRLGLEAGSI